MVRNPKITEFQSDFSKPDHLERGFGPIWTPPGGGFGLPGPPRTGPKTGPDPPKMGYPPNSRPPGNWKSGAFGSAVPRKRGPPGPVSSGFFEKPYKTLPSRGFLGVVFANPSFKIWGFSQGVRGPEPGFGPPDRALFAV